MRLHLIRSSSVLLSLTVAGCSTEGGDNPALSATGAVVAQANMPAYCLRAASSEYGVPFGDIETKNVVDRGGGFMVDGSANTGQKTYRFNCQFDSSRRFIGVSGQ